jgi:hypothetical protein
MKTVRPCELKPWKTKINDLHEIIKIFHVDFKFEVTLTLMTLHKLYRASHIRFIPEFILYATKNTDNADSLIPFIM